jgi:cytochrome c
VKQISTFLLGIVASALITAAFGIGQENFVNAAFLPCAVCHSIDGSNGTGPTLKGIVGRKSGSVPGFHYSRAMRNAALTWDAESLDQYLKDPQELIPGNVMPFSGVADSAQRAEIIAYLKSL